MCDATWPGGRFLDLSLSGEIEREGVNGMASCADEFDTFIDKISLKSRHVERIEAATRGLTEHLAIYYEIDKSCVFQQGSYPNGTAIRPPTGGEYDVDLVVVCAEAGSTAKGALDNLETAISDHGRYTDRIVPKKPCIRVEYADDDIGKFHVDVVPVRASEGVEAPFDCPRRNEGWHETAPAEYRDWCSLRGNNFVRTVKAFKRWRNEQQDIRRAVKSILLQVLVSTSFDETIADDALRLVLAAESMDSWLGNLDSVPEIPNPALEKENLAARWSWSGFQDFRRHLRDLALDARKAYEEDDSTSSAQSWRELFGSEFPLPAAESLGIALASTDHAQPLERKGLTESTGTPILPMVIEVRSWNRRKVLDHDYQGGVLRPDWWVKFRVELDGIPPNAQIWWQVTNTGAEAVAADELRGGFLRARHWDRKDSVDPRINWESTAYTGSHLVEAFLVDELGLVLGRTGARRIDIRRSKWQLRR